MPLLDRIKAKGVFAAGATAGGLLVGLSEGLFRDVSPVYAALLYGALWAAAGIAGAAVVALVFGQRHRLFGISWGAWGLSAALGASALILVRFIVLRDVLHEAAEGRWKASAAGLGAAVLLAGGCWLVSFVLGRRSTGSAPGAAFWAAPVAVLIAFVGATFGGDDPLPDVPAPRAMEGSGVVFVVVDTLRADVIGAYGAAEHRGAPATPRIDAFARRARVFSDVSAQASWTKPAVATLVTSRHVSGHDTMSKLAVLPESLPTVATVLQSAGVKTGAVVTNYNLEEGYGFGRGFDEFQYLPPARYLGAPPRANRLAAYNVYRLLREKLFVGAREARHFYRGGEVVNAVGFDMLERMGDDRFMLWLHYMEPHDPYFAEDGASYARVSHPHPPTEWSEKMRAAYRDDVRRFDTVFGELLDGLEARGLSERVTVVLVADHGEEFAEHGGFYHGVTLYEEQLFVPLMIAGPDLTAGVENDLARQIDVAPTIAARFAVPSPASWEGRDLFGDAPAPALTIAEEDHEGNVLSSVRYGATSERPLKLILANTNNPRGLPEVELFDLGVDPNEQDPLRPISDVAEELKLALGDAQAQAKKGGAHASTKEMDADAEAELRSLGYVQ